MANQRIDPTTRPSPGRGIRSHARGDDIGRAVWKPIPVLAILFLLVGLSPAAATRAPVWRAGFERGDFSEWQKREALPGDVAVVRTPVRDGRFASRFSVGPGDVPGTSGERAELSLDNAVTGATDGQERWYSWSTYFPRDFAPVPDSTWNIFTQFHETAPDGCHPNVAFQVNTKGATPMIRINVRGGRRDAATCEPASQRAWDAVPLRLGQWSDFVFHVLWSASGTRGFVELWIDGAQVVPKTRLATLYPGQGAYLKQGFYRAPTQTISTVYHDAMRVGITRTDVAPLTAR